MSCRSISTNQTAVLLITAAAAFLPTIPSFAQNTPPQPGAPVVTTPPAKPGETTETTIVTTTKPDGTTTTVITTKTHQAKSDEPFRTLQPDEKGLTYRNTSAFGTYYASDKSGQGQTGLAIKSDYLFYRTTRHEAMLSINSSITSTRFNLGVSTTALEYRWRFGDAGRAYTGIGLGLGYVNKLASGNGGFLGTSAIGYEFPSRTFVEYRVTGISNDNILVNQIMIGNRF